MRSVFVDTAYWIALLNPQDSLHPRVRSLSQTSALFREAFLLYSNRGDKAWSQTDCASFCIMRDHGITQALTHDRHFEQAGFVALLREER